jgi:hypothetical protein
VSQLPLWGADDPVPEPTCSAWESWAPPIDPPTAGGLPADEAQCIADQWWTVDPHLCAALMWEAYAAMLPPTPAVASVSTGAQSVSYSPAAPVGAYGLAVQRAAWHRSFVTGQLVAVPLDRAPPYPPQPRGWPSHWWPTEGPP